MTGDKGKPGCIDCVDGICDMNCGPAIGIDEALRVSLSLTPEQRQAVKLRDAIARSRRERRASKAKRNKNDPAKVKDALTLADDVCTSVVGFIELLCSGGDWYDAAHQLNDKVYAFRKANLA